MLDCEALLAPVTAEAPSGADLEYDQEFLAVVEAARGRPEQRMGASVIPAEPPDWSKVQRGALALLARTKDLRVAALLVKSMLRTAGAPGLFEGLAFTRELLERHWDTVHPRLDESDGGDAAMRSNALAELADPETILAPLRNTEVASARGIGRVRVRDLDPAEARSAAAPGADGEAPPVQAILSACDGAAIAQLARGAAAAVEHVRAIDAFMKEKVGAEHGPNLARLAALLKQVADGMGGRASAARDEAAPPGAGAAAQADGGQGPAAPAAPGAIASRSDVLAALDGICAYYERFEPSSPIPLLLRRSRRLVAMSFLDIVRDLVPEALPQVEGLRGKVE